MAAFGTIPAINEPSVKPASPTRNQDIPQATGDHQPNGEGEFVGGQHSLDDGVRHVILDWMAGPPRFAIGDVAQIADIPTNTTSVLVEVPALTRCLCLQTHWYQSRASPPAEFTEAAGRPHVERGPPRPRSRNHRTHSPSSYMTAGHKQSNRPQSGTENLWLIGVNPSNAPLKGPPFHQHPVSPTSRPSTTRAMSPRVSFCTASLHRSTAWSGSDRGSVSMNAPVRMTQMP